MRNFLAIESADTKLGKKVVPPAPISEAEKKAQEVKAFETKKGPPQQPEITWYVFTAEGWAVWEPTLGNVVA